MRTPLLKSPIPFLLTLAVVAVLFCSACAAPPGEEASAGEAFVSPDADEASQPETTSLLGTPLYRPTLPDDFRHQQEVLLSEAETRRNAAPTDPEAWIWVGRRTAYLGRYREAIDIYSQALEVAPDDPRLYRHRGHRYLTLRRLDEAAADLERGAQLVAGQPDEIEPDGLPNAQNIPTSTLQSNIWYHLGLVRYLQGDFEAAAVAYRECLDVSENPDMLSATTYWLYLMLRRLGQNEEAAVILEPITADLELIENEDYYRLLRLFQGDGNVEALLQEAFAAEDGVASATLAYGLGSWLRLNGEPERATEVHRRIVESESWAAFGYIAAEAELARGR